MSIMLGLDPRIVISEGHMPQAHNKCAGKQGLSSHLAYTGKCCVLLSPQAYVSGTLLLDVPLRGAGQGEGGQLGPSFTLLGF